MTKRLEEEFNLPPMNQDDDIEEVTPTVEALKTQIEEYKEALSVSEKVNLAFNEVKGLEVHDTEMTDIAKEAMDSYRSLMDLGMNVSDMAAGKVFAEASNMLKIALDASDAKTQAKLKQIDLMIKKERVDKFGQADNSTSSQGMQATVFDRNELLNIMKDAHTEAQKNLK